MELQLIYSGFDGLDVAFQGRIPAALVADLDRAKLEAAEARRPTLVEWRGETFHVAESGASGGFAFRLDTGPEGATWFLSRNQDRMQWNLRVSLKSAMLASLGLKGARDEIYRFLDALGADVLQESIGRVDYAVDFLDMDRGFCLDPGAFVMHSHTSRADHAEDVALHGVSGRYTSVTCGAMPGRQVIVYDKTKEIRAKRKLEWVDIWKAGALRQGWPPLEEGGDWRVWRVEIRAGKEHLKGRWNLTTWADLDAMLGDVFRHALADIRYTTPTADSHRHRWPLHPLWEAVGEVVKGNLCDMVAGVEPGVIKAVRRSVLAQTMQSLILGMLATWALATGTPAHADALPDELAGMSAQYLDENSKDFLAKMERAEKKYRFICEEGVSARDVGQSPQGDYGHGERSQLDHQGQESGNRAYRHDGRDYRPGQPRAEIGGAL